MVVSKSLVSPAIHVLPLRMRRRTADSNINCQEDCDTQPSIAGIGVPNDFKGLGFMHPTMRGCLPSHLWLLLGLQVPHSKSPRSNPHRIRSPFLPALCTIGLIAILG